MIRRLYLLNGKLSSPLTSTMDNITVDETTGNTLLTELDYGDFCYLTITDGANYEVIKVHRDYTGLNVSRGQDGTEQLGFSKDASIIYRLTGAEIQDACQIQAPNIYGSGYGIAQVNRETIGKYVISLPQLSLDCAGGISAYTDGENTYIVDAIGAYGCCGTSVVGTPGIPGAYFYLTSMLYPQEAMEIMTPQPKDNNGNNIPPINIDGGGWWTLVQPSLYEKYISQSAETVGDWNLFGGEAAFTAAPEKYINTSMSVGEMVEFGGQHSFTAKDTSYISTASYPLLMQLFGNSVEYDFFMDKYISNLISCGNMSLV